MVNVEQVETYQLGELHDYPMFMKVSDPGTSVTHFRTLMHTSNKDLSITDDDVNTSYPIVLSTDLLRDPEL